MSLASKEIAQIIDIPKR